jgi:hypothetical protein
MKPTGLENLQLSKTLNIYSVVLNFHWNLNLLTTTEQELLSSVWKMCLTSGQQHYQQVLAKWLSGFNAAWIVGILILFN